MTNDTKDEFNPDQFVGISMYAALCKPRISNNPLYPDAWQVDLLLDTRGLKEAQEKGYKVHSGNAKYNEFIAQNGLDKQGYSGAFIKATKPTTAKVFKDGNPVIKTDEAGRPVFENGAPVMETTLAVAPKVRDSARNVIDPDNMPSIGNGSKLRIFVTPKNGGARAMMRGEWGARLISTTILELKEYTKNTVEAGGYVYDAKDGTYTSSTVSDDMDDDIPNFARA